MINDCPCKMKILAITAFYPPHHSGGYELRCKEVLEGLIHKGHTVTVLTNRCPKPACALHPSEEGIQRLLHVRQAARPFFTQILLDCIDLRFIDRFVKQYAPDLIYLWHIQNLSNSILPYFSSRSIPIVFDEGGSGLIHLFRVYQRGLYFYQNQHDHRLKKLLKNWVYRIARLVSFNLIDPDWQWPPKMRVYFNSKASKINTQNHGVQVSEAAVIPSGIDITKFPFHNRDCLGDPIKILVPSRIKKEKGIRDAILLAIKLRENGIDAKVTIVGMVQSEEYYSEIRQLMLENGIGDALSFISMVDQEHLSKLYRENDFCFFPSFFRSGFSRVPLEAMASGCIVITYGNEGSSEVIIHLKNGIQVPESDINLAASWIVRLKNEPSIYRKIVAAAKQHIDEESNFEDYINRIETFLIG